jgi:hypothetical protein
MISVIYHQWTWLLNTSHCKVKRKLMSTSKDRELYSKNRVVLISLQIYAFRNSSCIVPLYNGWITKKIKDFKLLITMWLIYGNHGKAIYDKLVSVGIFGKIDDLWKTNNIQHNLKTLYWKAESNVITISKSRESFALTIIVECSHENIRVLQTVVVFHARMYVPLMMCTAY